jgi:hypothetical protein
MLIVSLAFAQAPAPAPAPAPPAPLTDEQVDAAVDQLYGRDIPAAAICIARPTLPEPLPASVIAVGTRRGERGCVLVGVVVNGALQEPLAALSVAADPAAFAKLPSATRNSALLAWTDQVLLAFDRPSATVAGTVTTSGGNHTVTRQLQRRGEVALRLEELTARWVYDRALTATVTETPGKRWQTTFFMRPVHVEGLDTATVNTALTAKGRLIAQCFEAAWEADPLAAGRVVFEWTVGGGKPTSVTVVADPSEKLNGPLARCYGNQIHGTVYPPEAQGRVQWSFAATRAEAAPEP